MSIEDKQASFEALLDEVSGALSDLVSVAKDGHASTEDMASALADMLAVMERRNEATSVAAQDIKAIVAAIKAIRIDIPVVKPPQVTVNVNPTPVEILCTPSAPVVQIIERASPPDYVMTVQYDSQGRIETARLTASNT